VGEAVLPYGYVLCVGGGVVKVLLVFVGMLSSGVGVVDWRCCSVSG
jgi:hypothetical protein